MALSEAQKEFLNKTYAEGRKAGLTDTQARLLATQAAHESNYGKSVGGDFNYWGIKAGSDWSGATENVTTREFGQGIIKDRFRSYPDAASALADRIEFMRGKFPDAANADSFDDAIAGLRTGKHGVYATDLLDPKDPYGKSLRWINSQIDPAAFPGGGAIGNALSAAGRGAVQGVGAINDTLRNWLAPRPETMPPDLRIRDETKLPPLRPAGTPATAAIAEALGAQAGGEPLAMRSVQTVPIDPLTGMPSTARSITNNRPMTGLEQGANNPNYMDKFVAGRLDNDAIPDAPFTRTGMGSTKPLGTTPLQSALDKLRQRVGLSGGAGDTNLSSADGNDRLGMLRRPGDVAMPPGVVPESVQNDLPRVKAELEERNLGSMPSYGDVRSFGGSTEPEFITRTIQVPVAPQNTPANIPLGEMTYGSVSRDSIGQRQLAQDVLARAPQFTTREIQVPNPNYVAPSGPVAPGGQGRLFGGALIDKPNGVGVPSGWNVRTGAPYGAPASPVSAQGMTPIQRIAAALLGGPTGAKPQAPIALIAQALMGPGAQQQRGGLGPNQNSTNWLNNHYAREEQEGRNRQSLGGGG